MDGRRSLGVMLVLVALPHTAFAFTFESVVTEGCHERITLRAIERSGLHSPAPAATPEDDTLAENLPFRIPAHTDLWTLSVLVGVRDNDLHGYSVSDLPELAGIHNGEHTQDEHCLRSLADDGSDGDSNALGSCRAFILGEIGKAVREGDAMSFENVEIALRWQRVAIPLSAHGFHLGRALHALQDSFAHSFRTEDEHGVLSVLNYIGPALVPGYQPQLGGYPHLSKQDGCDESDPKTKARVAAAVEASAALLTAAAMSGDRAPRMEAASQALGGWVEYVPGCNKENDWCGNAPPLAAGCSASGSPPVALLSALAMLLIARRRVARPIRAVVKGSAVVIALVVGSTAVGGVPQTPASFPAPVMGALIPSESAPSTPGAGAAGSPESAASTPDAPGAPESGGSTPGAPQSSASAALPPAPPASELTASLTGEPASASAVSLHFGSGISIDRGAANLTVGGALKLSRRLSLGLDLEYSPWFDVLSGTASIGTVNAYATLSVTWATFGVLEVRSAFEAGASLLLFNAPGARAGSVGVLVGLSPLRIDVQLSPRLQLELSPEIFIAAPSLRGIPLAYRQYRACIGMRWSL
jgi:hypothetical protein